MRLGEAFSGPSIHDLSYQSDRKYFHPLVRMLGPVAPLVGVGLDSFYLHFERNVSAGAAVGRRLSAGGKGEDIDENGRRLKGSSEDEDEDAEWMAISSVVSNPLMMLSDSATFTR